MRVVINTSVLVSAAIRDRLPERVLMWCITHPELEWLVTEEILDEYVEVMKRPKFGLGSATVIWWVELIVSRTRVVASRVDIPFPRDRKDAKFLACAASGDADVLLTGDGDFGEARTLISMPILSARELAERYAPELLPESATR